MRRHNAFDTKDDCVVHIFLCVCVQKKRKSCYFTQAYSNEDCVLCVYVWNDVKWRWRWQQRKQQQQMWRRTVSRQHCSNPIFHSDLNIQQKKKREKKTVIIIRATDYIFFLHPLRKEINRRVNMNDWECYLAHTQTIIPLLMEIH